MLWEMVPEYPSFRKVKLQDKQEIESLFKEYPTEVSERTFGSIFIWRWYEDRSMISEFAGHLLVSWRRENLGMVLLEPVGPEPARVIAELSRAQTKGERVFSGIFGIVEPKVSELKKWGLASEPLRDEWDYVYRTEDLISLRGSKYHSLRKEMKKATSEHALEYEPMTSEHQRACLELEEIWCDLKHCTFEKFSAAEDSALKEAISNMDELGLLGGVVLLGGKVQALTLGERLNATTTVVHFEKANPSIRGLYQVVNQQFCEHALKGFEFVNREQDLGELGLRRAKEGYHPHHFVEKHLLRFS